MTSSPVLERLGSRPEAFPGALLLAGESPEALVREGRGLAARLLCPSGEPDGSCDSCRRAAAGNHPDLLVVAPEGVAIRIDRVRQALGFAAGRPYEAARRVVLVLEAEKLGVESANALLKALEEPGALVRWILTTGRPESLLPTILSRCARAFVPAPLRAETAALWRERGLSADDAEDAALLLSESDSEPAERLDAMRALRERIVTALGSAFSTGRPAPLLLLADDLYREEPRAASLLAELLADAALAAGGSGERIRHRAVAGAVGELGRRRSGEALRTAAVCAADAPPDTRRGNRRLHFESLLLALLLSGEPRNHGAGDSGR